MKRLIFVLIGALVASATHAAETGPVVETFACKFNDGKTMADLDAATKYFNEQADATGGLKSYSAAQLVPIRANTEYDVIWIGGSPNLNTWASEGDAFQASGANARTQARFDEVVACESGIYFSNDLHNALAVEQDDNDAVIEAYGCTLNPGKTYTDLASATQAYKAATTALAAAGSGSFRAIEWTPFLANAPSDIAYLVVHDDMKSFAASNSAYLTSKEGIAAGEEFGKVVKCESGLYAGRRVRQAAPAE